MTVIGLWGWIGYPRGRSRLGPRRSRARALDGSQHLLRLAPPLTFPPKGQNSGEGPAGVDLE